MKGKIIALQEIQSIRPEQTITGAVKGVTVSQIEDLKATAWKYHSIKRDYEKLEAQYKQNMKHIPSFKNQLEQVKDKHRLEQLEKAFDKLPKEVKEQVMPSKTQGREGISRER